MKKNKIFLFILIMLFLFAYKFYLRDFYYQKFMYEHKKSIYQGLITLWDSPHVSVGGSDYGFIKNVISNFEDENELIQIDLRELNFDGAYKLADSKIKSKNHPDIVSNYIENKKVSTTNLLTDINFTTGINEKYNINVSENGRCSFPIAKSKNCIIINETIFSKLGINLPDEDWSFGEFLKTVKEIKKADTNKEYLPFDTFLGENSTTYMGFIIENGYENLDFNKLNIIKKNLKGYKAFKLKKSEEDVYYDLYNLKTAIFAGDFSDVNYLNRKNDLEFEFRVYCYPYEEKKVSFDDDILSYNLYTTDNMDKKEVMCSFINHLYEEESNNIANILGLIPISKANLNEKEIKYSHISNNLDGQSYGVNDEYFINHKRDFYESLRSVINKK